MTHKVDYHFHPNLPKNKKKAIEKCKKIWKSFEKQGINTVVVTEHNFKNPKRAYDFMKETKPNSCFVIPGMEHITKEGIDVLLFHCDDSIYDCSDLAPYYLSLQDTIDIAEKNKYACCIAHPHSLSLSAIIKKIGKEKYLEYLNKICAVEVSNSSFNNLVCFLNKPVLNKVFKKQLTKIDKTRKLPKEEHPENLKFVAVGSDAHHPEEIGTYCTIEADETSLFDKLVSNINPDITEKIFTKTSTKLLLLSAVLTFTEFLQKKKALLKKQIKWKK